MVLPGPGEIRDIHPHRGDLVWMPKGSWNRPHWDLDVWAFTIIFSAQGVQVNMVTMERGERQLVTHFRSLPLKHPIAALLNLLEEQDFEERSLRGLLDALLELVQQQFEQEQKGPQRIGGPFSLHPPLA